MSDRSDEARLRVLHATQLLDSPPERAFDRLTRLASGLLGAPVALVSLVDARRQFFKSALGLKEPWASRRETPLTHSFCEYATRERAPLVVDDARLHPVLRHNPAIRDLDVIAYAGFPLIVDGEAIGALCVIDDKPRAWSQADLELLRDLAESAVSEIELRVALREVHHHRALTDALLESLGDAVLAVDASRRYVVANAAARRVFAEGTEVGQPVPQDWSALHRSTRPDGSPLPSSDGALMRGLRGESTDGLEFTLQRPGAAEAVWVEASGRPVRGVDGEVSAAIAVYRDVTEKKRHADSLRHSEQIYRAIVHHLPNGAVFMVDREMRYVTADGPAIADILRSAKLQDIVGRGVSEVASDANRGEILSVYRSVLAGQARHLEVNRDGRAFDLNAVPILDGETVTHALAFLYDVTDRRAEMAELEKARAAVEQLAQELQHAAVTDELTGLLNRRGFLLVAGQEMKVAARDKRKLVLMFLDVNGMKAINDELGHEAGDRALVETAAVLRRVFRGADVIARFGGDEFVVLATDASETSGPAFSERLRAALEEHNAAGSPFRLAVSVGTSVFHPGDPETLERLLSDADAHMYEEKRSLPPGARRD